MGQGSSNSFCGPVAPYPEDALDPNSPKRRTFRSDDAERSIGSDGVTALPLLSQSQLRKVRALYQQHGPAPDDPQTGLFTGNMTQSAAWARTVRDGLLEVVAPSLRQFFVGHHPFHATFIVKWPGPGGELKAHQDHTMIDDEPYARGITIWCPLEDSSPESGGLHGVLGSHRLASAQCYRALGRRGSALDAIESRVYERYGVALDVAAGEAVAIDHRLVHFSPVNRTSRPRVVVAIGLRPTESTNIHIQVTADGTVELHGVQDDYFMSTSWRDSYAGRPLHVARHAVPPDTNPSELDSVATVPR